jgi:L-threonylcarbamoyladenylate synthase
MSCSIGTDVRHAAGILRCGGLVAFATETVYGLGANAYDLLALAKVFEAKDRPRFDPIIAHIGDVSGLEQLAVEVPRKARTLAERFWPGPLTLVLPKTDAVPDLLTAGLPSVGVRIPDHPLALELLRAVDFPVGAPSANPFGQISPTTAAYVIEQLGDKIDYVLDGGPCRVGLESTVIQVADDSPVLLRPGGLPLEEIERVIGPVDFASRSSASEDAPQLAPGMLARHYAPRTRLIVATSGTIPPPTARVGFLAFQSGDLERLPIELRRRLAATEVLSGQGDLREAAANFFAALRRLDALGLDAIVAWPFPNEGLGRALNDRLRRASR